MTQSDDCASNIHEFCNQCNCPCHGIQIDKETAYELLEVLNHQFVDYKYSHVHQLIKQLWELVGKK